MFRVFAAAACLIPLAGPAAVAQMLEDLPDEMQGVGVDENRIRVEGYADTVPLPEEELEGLDEAERLARHRRVVVRIY